MKKFILTLAVALTLGLASCEKSNEALINDYADLCKEMVQAIKDGDTKKIKSLAEKGEKLEKELSKRDLTEEEQAQLEEISMEMLGDAFSGTFDIEEFDIED